MQLCSSILGVLLHILLSGSMPFLGTKDRLYEVNNRLYVVNYRFYEVNYRLYLVNYRLYEVNYRLYLVNYRLYMVNNRLYEVNYRLYEVNYLYYTPRHLYICSLWPAKRLERMGWNLLWKYSWVAWGWHRLKESNFFQHF